MLDRKREIESRGSFRSIQELVAELGKEPSRRSGEDYGGLPGPPYRYPLGLWFRGEGRAYDQGNLMPSVFRKDKEGNTCDEISMFNMFRLRASDYRVVCHTTFDWLCLMQHYGLPSRLLDWTESPLVALYFAVRSEAYHHKEDGLIFVLEARRLNSVTDVLRGLFRSGIHSPENFNTVLRAEGADRASLASLLKARSICECDQTDGIEAPSAKDVIGNPDEHRDFLRRLRMPTAVFPYRSNGRMIAQYSLLTVHGGRKEQVPPRGGGMPIGDPIHLDEVNSECEPAILWKYTIPAGDKPEIKRQLERLGIHEGTLYPELEQQATYSKRVWTVPGP